MKITVAELEILTYQGTGTPSELRLYASHTFTNEEGQVVVGGKPDSKDFCQSVSVTVDGNGVIQAAAFSGAKAIDPTVIDEIDNGVRYSLDLYDTRGRHLANIYKHLKVPNTVTPTTWEDIKIFSSTPSTAKPSYPTWQQIYAYIASVVYARASKVIIGLTRLSETPVSLLDPVAVGEADKVWIATKTTVYLETYGHTQSGLTAALAAIGATVTELKVTSSVTVSTDTTIGGNVLLTLAGNGAFSVNTSRTLTINNLNPPPPNKQVFFGLGSTIVKLPVIHLDWWAEPGTSDDVSHAFAQITASQAVGAGKCKAGIGTWLFNACTLSNVCPQIEGSGTWDGNGTRTGTVFSPYNTASASAAVAFMFKVTGAFRGVQIRNLTIFLDTDAVHCKTIIFEGTAPNSAKSAGVVENCSIINYAADAQTQIVVNATDLAWECTELTIRNNLIVTGARSKSFSINTVNSQIDISNNEFICAVGVTNIYLEDTGFTTIRNNSFGGISGLADVETLSTTLTGVGNLVSGQPYLTLTTGQFDESIIGSKIKVLAFSAYVIGIVDPLTTSGLAKKVHLSANSTINATSEDTDIYTYSPNTGGAYTPIHVAGSHRTLNIESNVDEGYQYSLVDVGLQLEYPVTFKNNKFQSRILSQNSCTISDVGGNDWLSHQFVDSNPAQLTRFQSFGSTISTTSINHWPNIVLDEPEIWNGGRGDTTYTQTNDSFLYNLYKSIRELPMQIVQRRIAGIAGIPLLSVGSATTSIIQPLIEWARLHPKTKKVDYYYRSGYDYAAGALYFWSNVNDVYKRWKFAGKVEAKAYITSPNDDGPIVLTGAVDNWNPWVNSVIVGDLIVGSNGYYTISGIKLPDDPGVTDFTLGPHTGVKVEISYSSAASGDFGITLVHDNAASLIANRIYCSGKKNIQLIDGDRVILTKLAGNGWSAVQITSEVRTVMLTSDVTLVSATLVDTPLTLKLNPGWWDLEVWVHNSSAAKSPQVCLTGAITFSSALYSAPGVAAVAGDPRAGITINNAFSSATLDTTQNIIQLKGGVKIDSGGAVTMQAAQRIVDAGSTKVLKGSVIRATPM